MNETQFKVKVLAWLRDQPLTWAVKYHGGPMSTSGVPDLLCCVAGQFLALELKSPTAPKATRVPLPAQRVQAEQIVGAGGGWAVCWTMEQVQAAWDAANWRPKG
jgi:hypothetical protein